MVTGRSSFKSSDRKNPSFLMLPNNERREIIRSRAPLDRGRCAKEGLSRFGGGLFSLSRTFWQFRRIAGEELLSGLPNCGESRVIANRETLFL